MSKAIINSLIPHYQPIVSLSDGQIASYECLARFDNNGSLQSPGDHEHLFNDENFLDKIFFKSFFSYLMGGFREPVSFNICPKNLHPAFFELVEMVTLVHPELVQNLHFEVTEHNISRRLGDLPGHVKSLQALGYKVVLDDFGTGGANIECLEKIQFDMVKIDGGIVKYSTENPKILKDVVTLLRNFNVEIVAEHIENAKILDIVKDTGIEYGQGYFLGHPESLTTKMVLPKKAAKICSLSSTLLKFVNNH